MFKLKKILNSGINVPEPELLPLGSSDEIKAGSALVLIEGEIHLCAMDDQPTYMSVGNAAAGSDSLLCHRITPEMIFEVEAIGDSAGSVYEGCTLMLTEDGRACSAKIDEIDNGRATVVYMNGYAKSGDTVYVSFK